MKLYCIGIGPGGVEQMTLRAARALEKCDCVAGYGLYLDLIAELIEGKERIQTGMTKEVDRCTAARDAARAGRTVAVVSSGDAGVYGMAGLLLEVCGDDPAIEVEIIPGVTAACAGGAALGAPLAWAVWQGFRTSPTCSPRGRSLKSGCAARRRAIFASRFITPAAKRAPAICAAPAISCSRPCRRKPCAGWRAASAAWAKAIR